MRRKEFPALDLLQEKHKLVNYRLLTLDPVDQTVHLQKQGMRIDLGGIAKGFTVDVLGALLDSLGLPSYLIDGGGDLLIGDPPPGQAGWKIAVDDNVGNYDIGKAGVYSNLAIASSGISYRFLEKDGVRYGHIIDPISGLGISRTGHFTVSAECCMYADAWASALSVMGVESFGEICDQLTGCEILNAGK